MRDATSSTLQDEAFIPGQAIPEFNQITESPLNRASNDQLCILHTRYTWAAGYAVNKDVLEVACGAGVGLGTIAQVARRVVGGDIDQSNCAIAAETYKDRPEIEVLRLTAEQIPFPSGSFDLIILFEALYYLNSPELFFHEVSRLLRPGGTLLISSVNSRWSGFNPSPFSTKYYSATELAKDLTELGFDVSVYGGFPENKSEISKVIGVFRKAAVRLHLIPDTQKGKEWLKRIFYGALKQIPRDLQRDTLAPGKLFPLDQMPSSDAFRFIYWAARSKTEAVSGRN